jgi:glycerol-1-phosphate dehydrogenase [NAD(P)+]
VTSALPVSAPEAARDLPGIRQRLADAPDRNALRPLGLGGVTLGPGALDALPALVAQVRNGGDGVVLLADCRLMAGDAPDLKGGIEARLRAAGESVRRVTIGDAEARVRVDAETIDEAAAACRGAGALVSVGSGSVVDVAKAVCNSAGGLPHVVVQSAGSVNGFADDQSVMLVDGVKRTTVTRWPDRLLIDTEVVALAPAHLNRAGLGDLLATYTAPADWLLAFHVRQDGSYSPAVVSLARSHVDDALDAATGIGSGDPPAIEDLTAALTLSGMSMGVAGRTSPASGMEHTVSHLLEMTDTRHDASPLHGAKVGVVTVLAALLWARMRGEARDGALNELAFPPAGEMQRRVHDAFDAVDATGSMARECWSDYSRKLERWHDAAHELRTLRDRWASVDTELDALLAPPERLVRALRDAGAPTRFSDLGIGEEHARWALANCHLMRDRFTVADLAFLTGRWEAADVDSLLEEAATLGAGL